MDNIIFPHAGGGVFVVTWLVIAVIACFIAIQIKRRATPGIFGFIFDKMRGKETPAPTVAPATQIVPRKCPQCGAELKPDVSEGLCPACLLQHGIATEGGVPPGTPPFVPPTIPDLAKLFPQLEILELIGKGGMGAVYKARQPALDRFVALKILAPRSGDDRDFAGRFTREARALAKLSHPNIVGVYDFGQADRLSYFIMEYVDGPNLRQVDQAGKLTPREALDIIPQICTALQFAHDEGIVHRDIKPENVLLDKKGRVKIADFGLAKILGPEPKDFRLTGARDVVGTPHYMAPEQVEKPQEVDHRADIYSLGVVFYEMLTGELPLGKFQPPSSCARGVHIDVRLDEVVLHALEKAPERRYQHASQVKSAVETIATTQSTQGDQPAKAVSVSGWRDRWIWDSGYVTSMAFVPGMLSVVLFSILFPLFGKWAVFALFPAGFGLLFALTYSLVGRQVRRLKSALPASDAEVAEALFFRRPFQSPGLAVLHADRLELIGIVGKPMTVPLTDIASICEVRWFNGQRLFWKHGFVMDLKDGRRVGVAVPESFGRRWRAKLSGGSLPELPGPHASRMDQSATSAAAYAALFFAVLSGILGITVFSLFPDPPKVLVWSILVAALAGITLGLQPRRTRTGKRAMVIGTINLIIWLVVPLAINSPYFKLHQRELAYRLKQPGDVIAQTIQHEVGRQLREAGATYDDLQAAVATRRDSGTPYKVTYHGLQNFKGADGTAPAADGEFILAYIGGGQWQGTLAGTTFTVSVGSQDNVDLPFVNDPQVIGKWTSVDFVTNPSEFNPDKSGWPKDKLFLKDLTFLEGGKMPQSWMTWTRGFVMHHGNRTASRYEIREINGQVYLFFEWKSGDVMISGMKPRCYVLKKSADNAQ